MKTILITGATSGLGRELSFLLAKEGSPLLLTARNESALLSLKESLSSLTSVETITADLAIQNELDLVLQKIHTHVPTLVINSAGFGLAGDVLSFSLQEQMKIIHTNVEALTCITIEAARCLKNAKKKGTIMNISSIAGNFVYPSFALYASSKSFVTNFSQSLDREVSKEGIRILTCLPGQFASPFRKKSHKKTSLLSENPSWTTISLERTAKLVLKQIEKQKPYSIIDFRYKIFWFLCRFIPQGILATFLKKQNMQKQ